MLILNMVFTITSCLINSLLMYCTSNFQSSNYLYSLKNNNPYIGETSSITVDVIYFLTMSILNYGCYHQ